MATLKRFEWDRYLMSILTGSNKNILGFFKRCHGRDIGENLCFFSEVIDGYFPLQISLSFVGTIEYNARIRRNQVCANYGYTRP